jgi:hypothetical protein
MTRRLIEIETLFHVVEGCAGSGAEDAIQRQQ